MAATILIGGPVVTLDADRRVIDPGAVAVEGDRIAAVGSRDEVLSEHPDADREDLRHAVILPGLVDAHGHAGHGLTKNLADGTGEWLSAVEEIYFRATGAEFWRAEGRLAAIERLRAGVTTSFSYTGSMPRVDRPRYALAAATGYEEFGLRHVVGVGPPAGLPKRCYDPDAEAETIVDLDRAMATTEAVFDELDGAADGRLSVAVAPSSIAPALEDDGSPSAATAEQLSRVADLAERRDAPIQAHAYAGDVSAAAEAFPEVLSGRLSLAHCAGASAEELELMADRDVAAVHGPLTHAYVHDRFPVIEAMEAGVQVVVATDGAAPDRSFDLLAQGRIAAQLQRAHFGDPALLPAGTILEMLTIDAAAALGMADEIGSIEAGKRADVAAVTRRSAKLGPDGSVVPRVVGYADGGDVEFVMVDGETRLRDGRLVAEIDVDGILDAAGREARRAVERAGLASLLDPHPDLWGAVRYGD